MSSDGFSGALSAVVRPESSKRSCRIGFLISDGAGPCLAVHEAIAAGQLPGCTLALVICNITGAPGTEAARAQGLRAITLEGRGHEQREHEEAIDTLLRRMSVDLLCVSGYLRVLSRDFIRRWPGRILTLHNSLLPAFPGAMPERQALEFGAQVTGCTISILDETADALGGGPILVQRAIPIAPDETVTSLQKRLAPEEDDAYVEAIRRMCSGDYKMEGRRLVFLVQESASLSDDFETTNEGSEAVSDKAETPA